MQFFDCKFDETKDYLKILQESKTLFKFIVFLFIWRQWILAVACGIKFSDQGSNPEPLHWEFRVLTAGPPGKSHQSFFIKLNFYLVSSTLHWIDEKMKLIVNP